MNVNYQPGVLKCNLCLRLVVFNSRNIHTIRSSFTDSMNREVCFGLCLQDDCSQHMQVRIEEERNQAFIKEMLSHRPKVFSQNQVGNKMEEVDKKDNRVIVAEEKENDKKRGKNNDPFDTVLF